MLQHFSFTLYITKKHVGYDFANIFYNSSIHRVKMSTCMNVTSLFYYSMFKLSFLST